MTTELCRENAIAAWRSSLKRKDLSDEERVLGAIMAYERQQIACDLRAIHSPVPELVRYRMEGSDNTYYENGHLQHDGFLVDEIEDPNGEYVCYDQVESVIAAKNVEIRKLKDGGYESFKCAIGWQKRAIAAEAKLSQIWANKLSVTDAAVDAFAQRFQHRTDLSHQRAIRRSLEAALPHLTVATPSDREAEIAIKWLISSVSKMIADDEKFEGHIPVATIQKVYGAHSDCLRALSGKEPV